MFFSLFFYPRKEAKELKWRTTMKIYVRKPNAPDLFCNCLSIFGFRSAGDFSAPSSYDSFFTFVYCLLFAQFQANWELALSHQNVSNLCCRFSGDWLDCQRAQEKDYRVHLYLDGNFYYVSSNNLGENFLVRPDNLYYLLPFQGHPR